MWTKKRKLPDPYEQLDLIGAVVDVEGAIRITAFAWANGIDTAGIMFDVSHVEDE